MVSPDRPENSPHQVLERSIRGDSGPQFGDAELAGVVRQFDDARLKLVLYGRLLRSWLSECCVSSLT